MNKKDVRLDELLAKGSLSGPEYDEIFERVVERTEAGERGRSHSRFRAWAWVPAAALIPVLALWLLHRPDRFGIKGTPGMGTAAVDVSCGATGARVCHTGDVLFFTVNAAVASGYLGAFAERLDDPAHERIWYFADPANPSPLVGPGTGTVVVPRGIRIGPEHPTGKYRVTTWIANRPLARGEIDVAAPESIRGRATLDFEVVP